MDLAKILSISGKPGLYELISSSKNGLVVKSLDDGKKFTAFNHFNISSLEEISVYTDAGEVALKDIFKKIANLQENKEALSHKSSGADLTAFFEKAVPDYDRENVYISDIKKIIQWYNLLAKMEMLTFEEEKEEEAEKEEKRVAEKPEKKSPKKEKKDKE